jgi:hypothetical protein
MVGRAALLLHSGHPTVGLAIGNEFALAITLQKIRKREKLGRGRLARRFSDSRHFGRTSSSVCIEGEAVHRMIIPLGLVRGLQSRRERLRESSSSTHF